MTHLLVLYILHRWRAELVVNIDCVVSQLKGRLVLGIESLMVVQSVHGRQFSEC
jgi:hypothetical protein